MRIQLSEVELVEDLLAALRERRDCIAIRVGDAIEAAMVGSFADGGARELDALVRGWKVEHPAVKVVLDA
jgi:hypothetical protein